MSDEAFTLLEQAGKCRRLAACMGDARAAEALTALADDYSARARKVVDSLLQPTCA